MINITRRFHDAVLKVAKGISPGGGIELASVTCHLTLSEDLEGVATGASLYLQGFGEFEGQLMYGSGFLCSTTKDVTILVPKNIPRTNLFIISIDLGSIMFMNGGTSVPLPDPWIEIVDSDCINEENGAVVKDGTVTIEVGAEI